MFHGIVVYKDKGNGCLNGTWTNTGTVGQLMNESLRKVTISKNKSTYNFDWYNDTPKHIFTGIGLKSGKNHYAVSFIKVP